MLSSSSHRGFTLVEIMIAMGLTLLVTSALYRTLVSIQRLSRGQTERVSLQSNVRAGVLALASELRDMGTVTGGTSSRNDLITMAPDAVTYRAMRGVGFTCQVPTPTQITIARGSFSGYRDPQPGRDSAFLFVEGSVETGQEATWLPFAITVVSTATACPGGRGPGMTLTAVSGALPPVEVGTPVRIYEVMELRLYRSDGEFWLGARSVSSGENIQPMAGPLTQANGLLLEYLDRLGGRTGDLTAVGSIGLTVRGISQGAVHASGDQGPLARIQEELVTQVTLRNALH
ncbi:MAG TPA: prepilin-type N-terminal cleavage/methylation domain-containing protein [Gemmatimonadales bacterium]|nr:prepilin-type N-terminal cleavage/methylation domain-containing protein [Gemmatimonadales bacterium]